VTEKALEVSVGGMPLRMKYSEVALPSEVMSLKLSAEREAKVVKERKMSKFARRALEEDQGHTDVSHSKRIADFETSSYQPTMRTSSNTLDLRGWYVSFHSLFLRLLLLMCSNLSSLSEPRSNFII
jgi:hypothetical protein